MNFHTLKEKKKKKKNKIKFYPIISSFSITKVVFALTSFNIN